MRNRVPKPIYNIQNQMLHYIQIVNAQFVQIIIAIYKHNVDIDFMFNVGHYQCKD